VPFPQLVFLLFVAVAAGGLLMTSLIALKRPVPSLLSTGHGLAGLTAVVLLFAVNLHGRAQTSATSWWSLGILLSGMIGGLLLFRVIFKHRAPLPLVAVHASIGIVGIYLLYSTAF